MRYLANLITLISLLQSTSLFAAPSSSANGSSDKTKVLNPCSGVSRELSDQEGKSLAPVIALQLGYKEVHVLQRFNYETWNIVYVETYQSDEAFLFYDGNPLTHRYITTWGGGASRDEEDSVKRWIIENAHGVPDKLATCFAWHVTNDRDL
jgi:hypothetical protein